MREARPPTGSNSVSTIGVRKFSAGCVSALDMALLWYDTLLLRNATPRRRMHTFRHECGTILTSCFGLCACFVIAARSLCRADGHCHRPRLPIVLLGCPSILLKLCAFLPMQTRRLQLFQGQSPPSIRTSMPGRSFWPGRWGQFRKEGSA